MTKKALSFVALSFLHAVLSATGFCADQAGIRLVEEISKQEAIYQSRGDQIPYGYIVERSLLSYTHTLSTGFDRSLASLGPQHRWLDIGAGAGQAILDYFSPRYDLMHPDGRERRGRKAQAVAISIEDRRTPRWHEKTASIGGGQIQYLSGKRLREYSPAELGQYQLITDVAGGFSYTRDFSLFMQKVLAVLDLHGSFFTLLTDVRPATGISRPYYGNASFLTEIAGRDGTDVTVCSWLKSISCVAVYCESKADWRPQIEVFHLKKVCNDIAVPALTPVHYEAGTPPARRFRLAN